VRTEIGDVNSRVDTLTQAIEQVIAWLNAHPRAAYIEIEGHTDTVGPREMNDQLGLKRAAAAKQYLCERHGVPLHKVNVTSFGAEKPVISNQTREGRAMNRRIVIRVLS
jgi:outer membrane protein OmpA-like peptidoglycan-associated protein